jgi:hypothetical protein
MEIPRSGESGSRPSERHAREVTSRETAFISKERSRFGPQSHPRDGATRALGYRIARAYYESHADKPGALRAILDVKDADAFVAGSGYAPK